MRAVVPFAILTSWPLPAGAGATVNTSMRGAFAAATVVWMGERTARRSKAGRATATWGTERPGIFTALLICDIARLPSTHGKHLVPHAILDSRRILRP